ncbi:apolipophorins-like [Uloborus diversus]|uniref:apolipophorins-like n=1 Tax=Uloborus diversus TaxID=327109 RepID=UPI0024090DFC|nr:apolipophorins-like [Uloborus diversus]
MPNERQHEGIKGQFYHKVYRAKYISKEACFQASVSSKMVLELAILLWLGCLASAGPVAWDDSKCSQKCDGGSKFQYLPDTSYIYSFESHNEFQADRTSDLSIGMKATVEITVLSKCELVLQIKDASSQHGPSELQSSSFIQKLKKNPLPFSWNDGKIEHVCPNPEDSNDVNNVKKAILSAFQNSMRSFEFDAFNSETDVLGSCDTEYQIKKQEGGKIEISKKKIVKSCSNHLKGQTLLTGVPYESQSSIQSLPLLSNENYNCEQTFQDGIVESVECDETAAFKPVSDYGYVVEATGTVKLQKLSSGKATRILYKTPVKESLVFKYQAKAEKDDSSEEGARQIIQHLCANTDGLINKNAANHVHKLIYTIRHLSQQSLENIYNALKNKEICEHKKILSLFLDALKIASSGGSMGLLSKLVLNKELSEIDVMLWTTLIPFLSYVEEDTIAAAIPLLRKDTASRQALLGVSALANKFCSSNPDCETSNALKELSSSLKQFLGDKCQSSNDEEETRVLSALKAFGNLGYVGESADALFECANLASKNKVHIRIAALDAFRRSPCSEYISSKLLDTYKNKNEEDELRIAALLTLSKCASKEILRQVVESYSSENSQQVKVFTWSYLKNLRDSSDPLKAKLSSALSTMRIKEPFSTDVTKFSRNFELSLFSHILNVGQGIEGNLIHSKESFLPRSGNLDFKANVFGNQLDLFEVGGRLEDLEHLLEKLFGPRGIIQNFNVEDVMKLIPEHIRKKRSVEAYKSKIEALSERLGYKRSTVPRGVVFFRIFGHELGLLNINQDSLERFSKLDVLQTIKSFSNLKDLDESRVLAFLDFSVLFPSVTGRAYKLAANMSVTGGLKVDGKIDLSQPSFPIPSADIDGRFQPSILADEAASFTIHSESFEPGVIAETSLNIGIDVQMNFQVRNGRLLHLKLNRNRDRSEILHFKRTLYALNHEGKVELPKPKSYEMSYCTKYLQQILGVRYCASTTFPHVYNEAGKPKIPFVREMEASFVVEKVDKQMEGYELLLEVPESMNQEERRYRILFDTPKSAVNRKFSTDLTVRGANYKECTATWKTYTPFYTLDIDGSFLKRDESMQMKIVALGNSKRQYVLNLDVGADVRGARLVEYQPKLSLTIPNVRPIEITGTVVFARGRKEQITINLLSNSFDDPITLKGHLAKEGEINTLESNWKLHYEMNANAFQQIHRIQGTLGNEAGKGILLDLGHHYEPDGKSYESITVNAKIDNIEIRDRLSFRLDSKILLAEHQDLNTMLIWDVSLMPFNHYKSDLIFRYGENFDDDTHLIRSTFIHALHGDFDNFQKMDIENQVGLTISCLDFDKSAVLTAVWDFFDKPKLIVEAGIKTHKDKDIHLALNYNHLSEKPLKIASDISFTYKNYVFRYRDQAEEIAPHEYQGKSVIEPTAGKEITVHYTYRVKSQDHFHHEFDGTINFPRKSSPVPLKVELEFSRDSAKFSTFADTGSQSPYSINVALQRKGSNEMKLATPFLDGDVIVETAEAIYSIKADIKVRGVREDRRILMSGSITPGNVNTMDLDIQWDADNDAEKKISIKAKSHKELEDGTDKHMISATINYVGSINVDVTGKVSTHILRGPHYFKADFSGNMEQMAIEYNHEIKDGHMNSVAKFLRSGVEKIRADFKGKYILKSHTFELEAGLSLSSPYKTFDGKELYFRIMADSNDALRTFISEYRIKPTIAIGYVGKFDYIRKRGFPGNLKSNLLVTVHRRPIYEGNASVEYGNGKYAAKASFTPISKRKINFILSFEHAARFAAFHKSLSTSLQYLQSVEVNAVADLRNVEDAKLQSNLDVNSHKLYDVNTTLKMKSIIDFDGQILLFSRITPSVHVFSKAQTSGQVTKFDMNLDIDSNRVITGSGEMKKRKKGFNSDMSFKYKEKELLLVTIHQDAKSQRERNYVINVKAPSRTYTANARVNKERKTIKYETKLCRNDKCVNIDAAHKEENDVDEWQITYKRGSLEFSIERIRVSTNDLSRFHTVIYKGDKRYGYDLRIGKEGNARTVSLGTILPSREIIVKGGFELSIRNPKVKLELSLDGRNHPDRKLIVDTKFENHLFDDGPSKLDVVLSHPIFEKPIILHLAGDYKPSSARFFTADASIDYSSIPEEKLLAKLSIEKLAKGSGQMIVNMYHKDTKNLDFVMKANGTFNEEESTLGLLWLWKDENGADKDAYALVTYPVNQKRFEVVYWRPKIQYKLEGKIKTPERLLEDTCEVDLTSEYNGAITKAKYIADYETGCVNLTVFDSEGEASRIIEFCNGVGTRKLYSVVMQSKDEDGIWNIDLEQEVVQKGLYTIGLKQHMTPDFLGSTLFHLTSLADELLDGGLGTLPISDSPQYKKIKASFDAKVWEPSKAFFVQGAPKFAKDLKEDFTFLGATLRDYYNSLPPVTEVKQYFESMIPTLKHISYELWTYIYAYYENYFRTVLNFIDQVRQTIHSRCENNIDCRTLVKAYNEGGWRSLLQELRNVLLALPGKIQDFMENPSTDAKNFFKRAITVLKAVLQPLTKYRCGGIVFKVVQLTYNALEPHVQTLMSNMPQYYRNAKHVLRSNPYIVQMAKVLKESYLKVREEILKIDYVRMYARAKKCFEDYLLTIDPPTPSKLITVHKIDVEKGIMDFDLHTRAINQIISRITSISLTIAETIIDHSDQYNWNTLVVKVKRIADLNFFPPYEAQAMVIRNHHFITFDKQFYDFSGECGYLLSRDFEDGNFTFVLTAKEAEKEPNVFVIFKDTGIEIGSDKSVKANENAVELPYLSQDFSITIERHTIVIDDKHGVQVKCNLIHQICKFTISGWYYGKTAGLLGTYNYEAYDEFKRPKGQIANSATVLAKSWELKRGCKTTNLIQEVQINKNADYYKLCQSHFESSSSLLAACFSEVDSKDYFQLCLRHLAMLGDNKKGLCDISAAYVMECERNYVELNLPSKCLTCEAPDKTKLEHGDRKKYENLDKKSSDVVLIIEDSSCNKIVRNDLGNIARSIDRELQNEGFKDNIFGIVGFGGDVGSPKIYTSNGKTFFSSRDVATVVQGLKMTSKKVETSRAFEAMKFAVTHLERSDTAKSFVLFSCSPCKYDYKSLQYPVVQQILLERGISLHVINNNEIAVRKSTAKEKDIIGMDPDTVYHAKDVTQKVLVGDRDLRSQVSLPKDLCVALSQDVNGSFFSTHPLEKSASSDVKNWRGVFSRKFVQATQYFACQWCDCTSTRDHVSNTVCQPCEIKRPRLPYSLYLSTDANFF